MKCYLFSIIILFTCFHYSQLNAQSFTEKDFKILVNGKDLYHDSLISVEDLLKLKTVTANFSWLSIKSINVYIDFRTDEERMHVLDGTASFYCEGNLICDESRKRMKALRPTNTVTIQAYKATDKSGNEVDIPNLSLIIK